MRTNTYRAPRIVITVAPKFVTKTPHCSTAGTTEAEAIATIIFLTPLRYDEQDVGDLLEREGAYIWADMTSALCACTTSTLYAATRAKTMST